MGTKSHRVSTANFNKLIEQHKPNVVAYALMLAGGAGERDAIALKAMSAIWANRKQYNPSEWPGFCDWAYAEVANEMINSASRIADGEFAEAVSKHAARFLPEEKLRMETFDKAFFSLSSTDKEIASISSQHHRLKDRYIQRSKSLDQDSFDVRIETIKLSLLTKAYWKPEGASGVDISEADNLALMRFVAAPTNRVYEIDQMRKKLFSNSLILTQYFRWVSLQQAMMSRLEDEAGVKRRTAAAGGSFKLLVVFLLGVLMIPLFVSLSDDGSKVNHEAKRLAYYVIPEPSSVSLLAIGFSVLLLRRTRDSA